MLRRYNSQHLDTLLLKTHTTTIGSSNRCDIIVKGNGIASIHASIEANSDCFLLREHSLAGITKVNDAVISGQIEIKNGDLIQIGTNLSLVFDDQWIIGKKSNLNSAKKQLPTTILPVLGKKIIPISDSSRIVQAKRNQTRSADQSIRSSASSTESSSNPFSSSRSVGNNLLQRVVRLQSELIKKDEQIRDLMSSSSSKNDLIQFNSNPTPILFQYHPNRLESINNLKTSSSSKCFELVAYRGFVGAITNQLRNFTNGAVRNPQKQYSEIFTKMCRAVDAPFSSRITEIEKYCENVLIDNDFDENDDLIHRLEYFLRESRKEKIIDLLTEIEIILPMIGEAAMNAKENVQVCSVFTQWSRTFGDEIRRSKFTPKLIFEAIEDLKKCFEAAHMSRHWLPPSIIPILYLAASEIENNQIENASADDSDSILSKIEKTGNQFLSEIDEIKTAEYDEKSILKIEQIYDEIRSKIDIFDSFRQKRKESVILVEITEDDIDRKLSEIKNENRTEFIDRAKDENQNEIQQNSRNLIDQTSQLILEISNELNLNTFLRSPSSDFNNEEEKEEIKIDSNLLKLLLDNSKQLLIFYQREKNGRRNIDQPPVFIIDEAQEIQEKIIENSIEKERENDQIDKIDQESNKIDPIVPENGGIDKIDKDDAKINKIDKESEEIDKTVQENGIIDIENQEINRENSAINKIDKMDEEIDKIERKNQGIVRKDSENNKINRESKEIDKAVEENGRIDSEDSEVDKKEKRNVEIDKIDNDDTKIIKIDKKSEEIDKTVQENGKIDIENQEINRENSAINKIDKMDEEIDKIDGEPKEINRENSEINKIDKDDKEIKEINEEIEKSEQNISNEKSAKKIEDENDFSWEGPFSYHLRSHINTANGRPNIVYQYPTAARKRYFSPPMKKKRRSKSEEIRFKGILSNRPPFVLY